MKMPQNVVQENKIWMYVFKTDVVKQTATKYAHLKYDKTTKSNKP